MLQTQRVRLVRNIVNVPKSRNAFDSWTLQELFVRVTRGYLVRHEPCRIQNLESFRRLGHFRRQRRRRDQEGRLHEPGGRCHTAGYTWKFCCTRGKQ